MTSTNLRRLVQWALQRRGLTGALDALADVRRLLGGAP